MDKTTIIETAIEAVLYLSIIVWMAVQFIPLFRITFKEIDIKLKWTFRKMFRKFNMI